MADTISKGSGIGQALRLSVIADERRTDVVLPGNVPLAEVVPALARRLNLLEPETAFTGFEITRADGVGLDHARSLVAQGIGDGDVLALQTGPDGTSREVYDDIVEAVADVVESESRPWSATDTATTTVVAAAVLLGAAAALLLLAGVTVGGLIIPITGGLATLILLTCVVVLDRTGAPESAVVALMLVAAAVAAVAGFTVDQDSSFVGLPTAYAGFAAAAVGAIALLLVRARREYALIPLVAGLAVAGAGLGIEASDAAPGAVWAVVMAATGLLGFGIPWLALSATPLRVVSASDTAEIYADPEPIDRAKVQSSYRRGLRIQVALRVATGVIALLATPVVVATGGAGFALVVITYLGMVLGAREVYSRADVVTVTAITLLGTVLTIGSAAVAHPDSQVTLMVAISAAAALVVALGLLAPAHRLWLARWLDTAEILSLAALLPLAVLAGGWV